MRHWKPLAAALLAVGALISAGTAGATPPQPVTITADTIFVTGSVDKFTSTGGVVCASGEVTTPWLLFVGGQNGVHGQLLVAKHFVCEEGTFDALLRVRLDFETGATEGTWSIVSGTGAYQRLHGGGEITGDPTDTGVLDEYAGKLSVN
jgi:hypothetical protein